MKPLLLLAAAASLAGCASGGHCVGELDYQKAANLPVAEPVPGLKAADTSAALRIPPEQGQRAAYAEQVPDPKNPEKTRTRCLDTPPRLAEEPAAPAAPAAAAPAVAPAAAEPPKTP